MPPKTNARGKRQTLQRSDVWGTVGAVMAVAKLQAVTRGFLALCSPARERVQRKVRVLQKTRADMLITKHFVETSEDMLNSANLIKDISTLTTDSTTSAINCTTSLKKMSITRSLVCNVQWLTFLVQSLAVLTDLNSLHDLHEELSVRPLRLELYGNTPTARHVTLPGTRLTSPCELHRCSSAIHSTPPPAPSTASMT